MLEKCREKKRGSFALQQPFTNQVGAMVVWGSVSGEVSLNIKERHQSGIKIYFKVHDHGPLKHVRTAPDYTMPHYVFLFVYLCIFLTA